MQARILMGVRAGHDPFIGRAVTRRIKAE
eukprot:COSAG02_NODE_60254_length_272_cov_0.479769_1_plen_28_part_01